MGEINALGQQDWVSWALSGLAAVILFLLSLGVKDIRDRIRKAEEAYGQVGSLFKLSETEFSNVKEKLKVIEDRIRLVEDRLRLVEDRITRIEVFNVHQKT